MQAYRRNRSMNMVIDVIDLLCAYECVGYASARNVHRKVKFTPNHLDSIPIISSNNHWSELVYILIQFVLTINSANCVFSNRNIARDSSL